MLACCGENREQEFNFYLSYIKAIYDAIGGGQLKGLRVNTSERFSANALHRDDFKRWLSDIGEWPIVDCMLKYWWYESAEDWKNILDQDGDTKQELLSSSGSSSANREAVLSFLLSQKCTPKEAKRYGIAPRKGQYEIRNFEICFECNQVGALNMDERGNIILNDKGDREKKRTIKAGAGWHKLEGGVYFIVGEKYNLSPSAIERIYNSDENTQHRKLTKPVN